MGQTISSSFVWKRGDGVVSPEDEVTDGTLTPDSTDQPLQVPVPIELSDEATRPKRATEDAAGFDLHAAESVDLPPGCVWTRVATGVKLAIGAPSVKQRIGRDTVVYGAVRARSGLTSKGIDVFHGTIDADYRGEIVVLMRNTTNAMFQVERGDRVAQLIFSIALVPQLVDYEGIERLFGSDRGASGFGSTGMKGDVPHAVIDVAAQHDEDESEPQSASDACVEAEGGEEGSKGGARV
jgi:dUTP pyrophosphatase